MDDWICTWIQSCMNAYAEVFGPQCYLAIHVFTFLWRLHSNECMSFFILFFSKWKKNVNRDKHIEIYTNLYSYKNQFLRLEVLALTLKQYNSCIKMDNVFLIWMYFQTEQLVLQLFYTTWLLNMYNVSGYKLKNKCKWLFFRMTIEPNMAFFESRYYRYNKYFVHHFFLFSPLVSVVKYNITYYVYFYFFFLYLYVFFTINIIFILKNII